jgi:hypothetical protein
MAPGVEAKVKCLRDLEIENSRLRKGLSDLTLDKLILQEAARGKLLSPARLGASRNDLALGMRPRNSRLGIEITTRSDLTAQSVTKPRSS